MGHWSWRGSVLLAALLLHPYLLVLVMDLPVHEKFGIAGLMSILLLNVALLAGAVILKFDSQISGSSATGWLAVAMSFVSVQNIPIALLAVSGPAYAEYTYTVGVTQVPLSLVWLGLVLLVGNKYAPPIRNPLPLGILLGAVAGTIRLALVHQGMDPTLRFTGIWPSVLTAASGLVVLAGMIVLVRCETLPPWARGRLALMAGFLWLAKVVHEGDSLAAPSPFAVALGCIGAVLLCGTAVALFRQTLMVHTRRLVTLAQRAATAEVNVRHGKEKMHELHATIAGVAQASRLLMQMGGPVGAKRVRLERMLDAETARLERMLSERGSQAVGVIDVDDVIQPLIEAQRTLGNRVSYQPSGLQALGRPDDVVEVVHILLANAARHAPGSLTNVSCVAREGNVEIRVTDEGPGIPAELRPSLFEWGTRRVGSPGQGIGLQLAKRLMLEQAGNLRLEQDGRPRGAVFVATLPAPPQERL